MNKNKNYHIKSNAVLVNPKSKTSLAGFIDIGEVINDAFKCHNLACCDETNIYIRKAYLVRSLKQPADHISLNKVLENIYTCCNNTLTCVQGKVPKYWISNRVLKKTETVETQSLTKIVRKAFVCCGLIPDCNC